MPEPAHSVPSLLEPRDLHRTRILLNDSIVLETVANRAAAQPEAAGSRGSVALGDKA